MSELLLSFVIIASVVFGLASLGMLFFKVIFSFCSCITLAVCASVVDFIVSVDIVSLTLSDHTYHSPFSCMV